MLVTSGGCDNEFGDLRGGVDEVRSWSASSPALAHPSRSPPDWPRQRAGGAGVSRRRSRILALHSCSGHTVVVPASAAAVGAVLGVFVGRGENSGAAAVGH